LAKIAASGRLGLMAIATFGLSPAGLAMIEEIALMIVADNWVPYDSVYEKRLVDALAKIKSRSVKSLRYNLPQETPSASAILQTGNQPVGLYIVPQSADRDYEDSLIDLIASRQDVGAWVWRIRDSEMSPLPVA
jgi:hypothetical protein